MIGVRRSIEIVAGAFALLYATTARADGDDTTKRAAEALFEEGRDLMKAERYGEACPKLARSQELAPGIGTLLNLGLCLTKTGKTASAWLRFREAAALAAQKKDAREQYARERMAELEPALAKLDVDVAADARAQKPVVQLDGADLPPPSWGVAIPVDPGEHVIRASAEGKRPWSRTIMVVAKSEARIDVPALEIDPDAPDQSAPPPQTRVDLGPSLPPPASSPSWQTVGIGLAATGGIAMLTGTVLGIWSKTRYDATSDECFGNRCTMHGLEEREAAFDVATAATIAFVAGAVLLATGGGIYFAADKKSTLGAKIAW